MEHHICPRQAVCGPSPTCKHKFRQPSRAASSCSKLVLSELAKWSAMSPARSSIAPMADAGRDMEFPCSRKSCKPVGLAIANMAWNERTHRYICGDSENSSGHTASRSATHLSFLHQRRHMICLWSVAYRYHDGTVGTSWVATCRVTTSSDSFQRVPQLCSRT